MPSSPVVLTIAGFDPSSGAGATADLKTAAAHGCYGIACLTALTVQSTQGVRRVEAIPDSLIRDTLRALVNDFDIAAVKIGMLGTAAAVKTIAKFVSRQKFQHVVLDPVLRSSSGASLLDAAGTETLVRRLLRSATMVTPNTEEASVLTGLAVTNVSSMKKAAVKLHEMGASAMVITGGALNPSTDLLSISRGADLHQKVFRSRHLKSNSTHGTGCAFSTALACNLASGKGLEEAVRNAKAFVRQAIKYGHVIGHGTGPVNPLFVLNTSRSALTKRRR